MNGPNKLEGYIYNRLETLVKDKKLYILDPFVSHKENEVLWLQSLGPFWQHFIFFATYEWVQ